MKNDFPLIRRYATLDFLKALGSITILIYHYFSISQYGVPTNLTGAGNNIFIFFQNYGHLAVELFFLISGFVAAAFSTGSISNGQTDLKGFLAPKWKRWYPNIFFTTVACLILQLVAIFKTGNMVLGLGGYHLFDVFCNFFVIQVGIFSERSMLNVPLWFLTPLLICYILFFLTILKLKNMQSIAYAVYAIIGGICIYYGYHFPILNVRLGRGLYAFFIGVIFQRFTERKILHLQNGGKVLLLMGIAGGIACFRNGTDGNAYLSIVWLFAMVLSIIQSTSAIDCFFARPAVRACYYPFYQLSFELFCTQYVVLTAIGLIGRYTDLSGTAENWTLLLGYITLSYILAYLLKRIARPLFSSLVLKI